MRAWLPLVDWMLQRLSDSLLSSPSSELGGLVSSAVLRGARVAVFFQRSIPWRDHRRDHPMEKTKRGLPGALSQTRSTSESGATLVAIFKAAGSTASKTFRIDCSRTSRR